MEQNQYNNLVRPKKALGQHFLVDLNIARKIVDSMSNDVNVIVEVGAGMGVLTQYLIQDSLEKLRVVEIDTESIEYLKNVYPQLGENLIHGDFLKTDLSKFASEKIGVIGNFPYNISSQIFFQVLKYRNQVDEVVGMIQKEVAERIAAGPGSKTYGILSVLLQAWYDIEYLFTVHENVFNPPPKVKSAVIRMRRNNVNQLDCDEKTFVMVVKQSFNQRRKTLGSQQVVQSGSLCNNNSVTAAAVALANAVHDNQYNGFFHVYIPPNRIAVLLHSYGLYYSTRFSLTLQPIFLFFQVYTK